MISVSKLGASGRCETGEYRGRTSISARVKRVNRPVPPGSFLFSSFQHIPDTNVHPKMASLVRSTANRAVHLRIIPRPSNLGESKEILRLVSQFGEVEYFKNLKYDHLSAPNAALVIYKDDDAAQHCIRKSPIRFRMGKAFAGESTSRPIEDTPKPAPTQAANPFDQGTASPIEQAEPVQSPFQHPQQDLSDSQLYQIQVNPARVHFRDQINMGHYHGSFPIDTKSVAQGDLAKSVPLPGLSCVDWRAGEKPWRIIKKEQFQEHESFRRRKSLRELYEDGARSDTDTIAAQEGP